MTRSSKLALYEFLTGRVTTFHSTTQTGLWTKCLHFIEKKHIDTNNNLLDRRLDCNNTKYFTIWYTRTRTFLRFGTKSRACHPPPHIYMQRPQFHIPFQLQYNYVQNQAVQLMLIILYVHKGCCRRRHAVWPLISGSTKPHIAGIWPGHLLLSCPLQALFCQPVR